MRTWLGRAPPVALAVQSSDATKTAIGTSRTTATLPSRSASLARLTGRRSA